VRIIFLRWGDANKFAVNGVADLDWRDHD